MYTSVDYIKPIRLVYFLLMHYNSTYEKSVTYTCNTCIKLCLKCCKRNNCYM